MEIGVPQTRKELKKLAENTVLRERVSLLETEKAVMKNAMENMQKDHDEKMKNCLAKIGKLDEYLHNKEYKYLPALKPESSDSSIL